MWRTGDGGPLEILVVHRPRYDDWTLPKGKVEPGESDEACALREVEEETGLRCELGDHLRDVEYEDSGGRPKVARYWGMRPLAGEFRPHEEVDEVRWLPVDEAVRQLSYEGDAEVVLALAERQGAA